MRKVKYKTYWAYASRGVEREGTLLDLILDMVYFIEHHGVIPPLHVLNEKLQTGGDRGGMGPGTKWRPFKISAAEYHELVEAWLQVNPQTERAQHPYVYFEMPIVDETLHDAGDLAEWIRRYLAKYSKH